MKKKVRTKKGAKRQTISATVTLEGKKQMKAARARLGTSYADMIRMAVLHEYNIKL